MVNFYLGRLGVAQSEIGFPFLFHEVPYVRACVALAQAGAFGELRLSGWCRAVPADVESALPLGLRHYNLSISTSDQMIAHKFRGRLDRAAIIGEMTAAVAVAQAALRRAGGAQGEYSIGVNAEDGSRTDEGYLTEFALAARDAARRGSGTATPSAATPPGGSGSGSPSSPPRSASRSRRTATTTWAWPSRIRCPAR
jgi:homocitrate synthase NifV